MSEIGSPAAVAPTEALRAILQQYGTIVLRGEGDPRPEGEQMIDAFLADWVVMKPSDYQFDLAQQHQWQQEARLGFSVFITALGRISEQFGTMNLGPRVLEEAEKMIREKGLDPEDILGRFLP